MEHTRNHLKNVTVEQHWKFAGPLPRACWITGTMSFFQQLVAPLHQFPWIQCRNICFNLSKNLFNTTAELWAATFTDSTELLNFQQPVHFVCADSVFCNHGRIIWQQLLEELFLVWKLLSIINNLWLWRARPAFFTYQILPKCSTNVPNVPNNLRKWLQTCMWRSKGVLKCQRGSSNSESSNDWENESAIRYHISNKSSHGAARRTAQSDVRTKVRRTARSAHNLMTGFEIYETRQAEAVYWFLFKDFKLPDLGFWDWQLSGFWELGILGLGDVTETKFGSPIFVVCSHCEIADYLLSGNPVPFGGRENNENGTLPLASLRALLISGYLPIRLFRLID